MIDNGSSRNDLLDEGYIYINIDHICAFNDANMSNETTVRLTNGDCWPIPMSKTRLIEKMKLALKKEGESLNVIELQEDAS
jgi:hypothetical protein